MKISYGNGKTEYGPGVDIKLTGDEVAEAIDLWLSLTGRLIVSGPRAVTVNGRRCEYGLVYVDPSGSVKSEDGHLSMKGAGEITPRLYGNEYTLYLGCIQSLGSQFKPLSYDVWVLHWIQCGNRQQSILEKYAQLAGQPSPQKMDAVASAICFSLDVGARS